MMYSECCFFSGGAVTAAHFINVLAARRSKSQRGHVRMPDASRIFKITGGGTHDYICLGKYNQGVFPSWYAMSLPARVRQTGHVHIPALFAGAAARNALSSMSLLLQYNLSNGNLCGDVAHAVGGANALPISTVPDAIVESHLRVAFFH